jgi:hypothetical protein
LNSRGSQQHCHAQGEGSGNCDLYEAELDVQKEKRNQKYLISMVTIFAICLCPLMVLRYVREVAAECGPCRLQVQPSECENHKHCGGRGGDGSSNVPLNVRVLFLGNYF